MNTLKKRFVLILIACFSILYFAVNDCSSGEFKITPEGQKLYDQWVEVIGHSTLELVKKMDPAPEIKEGLVITPENAKEYPGLKKILPETVYRRLNRSHFLPIEQMTITDTRPRYYDQDVIAGSRECRKNCRVNPDTLLLEGWSYGVPFAYDSKNPLEWCWNQSIGSVSMAENVSFDPCGFTTFSKQRKIDSAVKAILARYRTMGRQSSDIGKNRDSKYFEGQGIFEIGTLAITYPPDVKGTATIRTRYWDIEKPDYFVSYLPGLKRIRILSGSDAQDPLFGSEVSWDMWGLEWQKQPSKTIFPNEYKIIGKRISLVPTYEPYASLEIKGEQYYSKWEKRVQVMLEVTSLDPAYCYSKRIMFMDMEHFRVDYEEYYDRRGDLWRTWQDFKYLLPKGSCQWEGADVLNHINERHTIFDLCAIPDAHFTGNQLDMRWLIRMAR